LILFGVKSPLVVDYEESLKRLNVPISVAVSLDGPIRAILSPKVVKLDEFTATPSDVFLACAFAPVRRQALIAQGRALGMSLAEPLIDPHAVVASTVSIGAGTYINAGVIVGAVTVIGEGVLINRAASVGHHCLIQDFVSIGPGATLAGNIRVEEGVTIGAGAVILPELRIGAGAIIAAGSVVRGHVPAGVLVAGNPARRHPHDPKRTSLHVPGVE
jgi:sugar O-acyltransferase (sialic acid O-acetyltransferase NeuD family)